MKSATLDVDGAVHYADFGGSGPPMILVHGLGGSHLNWAAVGEGLATKHRVVAPDLAGFGRTAPLGRLSSVGANRALLSKFAAALFPGEKVTLVGNSMGGLISLIEAEKNPHSVERLVLVAPSLPKPPGVPFDRGVAWIFLLYLLPLIGPLVMQRRTRLLGPERSVRETLALCCADASRIPPPLVEQAIALARERLAYPWASRSFLVAAKSVVTAVLSRQRFLARLERVKTPALLIHGTLDRLVPVGMGRDLAQRRPDWIFEEYEGIGHVPQLEAPERFVESVLRFASADRSGPAGS